MTQTQAKPQDDHGRSQAIAQLDSIKAMVGRLEHAGECDGGENCNLTAEGYDAQTVTDQQREDYHDKDAAREAIQEDPLSVEVRSGWVSIGGNMEPEEFQILLCTGGPAVRIMGELDEHGEPSRAWLEYQDWGTPWTHYATRGAQDALLAYAREFISI